MPLNRVLDGICPPLGKKKKVGMEGKENVGGGIQKMYLLKRQTTIDESDSEREPPDGPVTPGDRTQMCVTRTRAPGQGG